MYCTNFKFFGFILPLIRLRDVFLTFYSEISYDVNRNKCSHVSNCVIEINSDQRSVEPPNTSSRIFEENAFRNVNLLIKTERDENSDETIEMSKSKEKEENDEIPMVCIPVSQLTGICRNIQSINLEKNKNPKEYIANKNKCVQPISSNISNEKVDNDEKNTNITDGTDNIIPANVAGNKLNRQMTLDKWIPKKSKTDISKTAAHIKIKVTNKSYECKDCKKRFITKSSLNTHLKTHIEEKLFQCDYCQKRYRYKFDLNTHMRSHKDSSLSCSGCFRGFSKVIEKESHEKDCKRRRYECYLCNRDESKKKKFVTIKKSMIEKHFKTHTGEKPHQCDRCFKRFSTKYHLKTHTLLHTGKKPHRCDRCNKRFRTKSSLNEHFRTHTREKPYQCDHCFKRFRLNCILNEHIRIHTGERKYQCDRCKKGFITKSKLNRHIRIHYA